MSSSGNAGFHELSARRAAAERIASSGVVISKTGGAYKVPGVIIRSQIAQSQLAAVVQLKKAQKSDEAKKS